jgi:hypothetical protein
LTPISWADFDLYRQRSLQPYSLHGAKSEAQDNGEFLRLLLDATAPDAWRGFERDGQPLLFDKSMLLKVLKRNIELGLRFISELRETIIRLGQAESNELKN